MKHPPEEHGEKVPLWIISFADMITLLLAFFVMLQTMAKSKDHTLMKATERSFVNTLNHCGLPDFLFSAEPRQRVDYRRLKYPDEVPVQEPEEPAVRTQEEEPTEPAEILDQICRGVDVAGWQGSDQHVTTYRILVPFPQGGSQFDAAGATKVRDLAGEIAQNLPGGTYEIAVMGYAFQKDDSMTALTLSSQRARQVGASLRSSLAAQTKECHFLISSWGMCVPADKVYKTATAEQASTCALIDVAIVKVAK